MASNNTGNYALAAVFVTTPDGGTKMLSQGGSISIDRTSGSIPVKTLQLGYAGESPGSAMTEISVDNAVPVKGFEFDPGAYMDGVIPVKFAVFAASSTLQFTGFIYADTFSQSTDGEAKLSFKARGGLGLWETGF